MYNFNKHEILYAAVTPELQALVDEYNQAIDTFLDALKGMEVEIFGTRCDSCNELTRNHKYRIRREDCPEQTRRWEREARYLCCDICYNHFIQKHKLEPKPHHLIT